jgi:lysophospholipase L1-like esterase
MKILKSILILSFIFLIKLEIMAQEKLLYLALGDSYTIGEAVDADKAWPKLLSDKLNQRGIDVHLEEIIAKTGWTTDELLVAIDKNDSLNKTNYDLVSLLIGVNNQFRGYGFQQYQEEFELLLKKAITLAGNKVNKVFVVSIPDYGITPFASENNKNSDLIENELYRYNSIAKNISDQYGVRFFDIMPISQKAIWRDDFVAKDKLHPSAKMYAEWVEYIEAGVFQLLNK